MIIRWIKNMKHGERRLLIPEFVSVALWTFLTLVPIDTNVIARESRANEKFCYPRLTILRGNGKSEHSFLYVTAIFRVSFSRRDIFLTLFLQKVKRLTIFANVETGGCQKVLRVTMRTHFVQKPIKRTECTGFCEFLDFVASEGISFWRFCFFLVTFPVARSSVLTMAVLDPLSNKGKIPPSPVLVLFPPHAHFRFEMLINLGSWT